MSDMKNADRELMSNAPISCQNRLGHRFTCSIVSLYYRGVKNALQAILRRILKNCYDSDGGYGVCVLDEVLEEARCMTPERYDELYRLVVSEGAGEDND